MIIFENKRGRTFSRTIRSCHRRCNCSEHGERFDLNLSHCKIIGMTNCITTSTTPIILLIMDHGTLIAIHRDQNDATNTLPRKEIMGKGI